MRRSVLPVPTVEDANRWDALGLTNIAEAVSGGDAFAELDRLLLEYLPKTRGASGLLDEARVAVSGVVLRGRNAVVAVYQNDRQAARAGLDALAVGIAQLDLATSPKGGLWAADFDRRGELIASLMVLKAEQAKIAAILDAAKTSLKRDPRRNEFLEVLLRDLRAVWSGSTGAFPSLTRNDTSPCRFPAFVIELLTRHLQLPVDDEDEAASRLRNYHVDAARRLGWRTDNALRVGDAKAPEILPT